MSEMEFEMRTYSVYCPHCGIRHGTEEVVVEDVEEDSQGRDVCYFLCPITGLQGKSLVTSN